MTRAGIYARSSVAKARSIAEQLDDMAADVTGLGWTVSQRYQDKVGASRYSRSTRPDWARLLEDVRARRIDAVVLWEVSRADRKLTSWSAFLDEARERGLLLRVTNADRTFNLGNDNDWAQLAQEGVAAVIESDRLSKRVSRAMVKNAADGKPHGPVPFGYRREYDPETKKFLGQVPDEATAPLVRRIFTDLRAGVPLSVLTEALNAAGEAAPDGVKWYRSRVRAIATNPAYIGQRKHKGVVGPGTWPALVSTDDFHAVSRLLSDPARKTTRPGAARWLLSYLAECGVCGTTLHASSRRSGTAYQCSSPQGCVAMKAEWLDDFVTQVMVARLAQPDVLGKLEPEDDAAVLAAREELAGLRLRLDEFYTAAADGQLTPAALSVIEARLRPQIEAAQRRAQDASAPPELRELVGPAEQTQARWDAAALPARKAVVRLLARVVLLPSTKPSGWWSGFDPERVSIEWV